MTLYFRIVQIMMIACIGVSLSGCAGPVRSWEDLKQFAAQVWETDSPHDPVLVRMDGDTIRVSEFRGAVAQTPLHSGTKDSNLEERRRRLEMLIMRRLVARAAKKSGIASDPEYKKSLAELSERLLMKLYIDRLMAVPITEDDIKLYYNSHLTEFSSNEIIASHIVLKSALGARKVQQLLAAGKPFADVAKSLSMDKASAREGGRLPPHYVRRMDPALQKVLLSLRDGQVSSIQRTSSGYELIRKDGSTKGAIPLASDMKNEIRAKILMMRLSQAQSALRNSAHIQVDEKALAAVN